MRHLLAFAFVVVTGCSSPTAPTAAPWHEGRWTAVRADGRPLPYATPAGQRIDSLVIVFTTTTPLDQYSAWSYAGSTGDGTTTRVTAIGVWSGGQRIAPEPPPFRLSARLSGDSLIVDRFAGVRWSLVRRP